MRIIILSALLVAHTFLKAQSDAGTFSLGVRNTVSLFDHDKAAKVGYGIGGQYRVQVLDRLNTEWFLDYLQQDLGDIAFRKDIHIGWSLMFYPWLLKDKSKHQIFKPYIVAGHCFDWSELHIKDYRNLKGKKFSSAIQAGTGAHFNISKKMDVTLLAQYMIHLGKDVAIAYDTNTHVHNIDEYKHTAATGHLLITVGLNYKIAKLWKTKS